MLLSCYMKKNQPVVPKSKEKKKHFKNFRQVALTLPWRQEKKHHTVQARRSEQHSSIVLAIPALGPEWCVQERKKNVVGSTPWRTIWMLSWRRLRGYFVCYVFSEVSLMCVKRKWSRQTWQRSNPAAIAHVTNRYARWDEVRIGDALVMA